jgi:hypothetical protein
MSKRTVQYGRFDEGGRTATDTSRRTSSRGASPMCTAMRSAPRPSPPRRAWKPGRAAAGGRIGEPPPRSFSFARHGQSLTDGHWDNSSAVTGVLTRSRVSGQACSPTSPARSRERTAATRTRISLLTQTEEPPIVLLGGTYSAARDSYASLQVKGTPGLLLNARAVQIELQGHPVFEFPRLWSVLLDIVIGCAPVIGVLVSFPPRSLPQTSSVHTQAVPGVGARPLAQAVTQGVVRYLAPWRANRGECRRVPHSRLVVAQLGAGVVERLCLAVTVRHAAGGETHSSAAT